MARRRPTKNIKEVRPTIIGAGINGAVVFHPPTVTFWIKDKDPSSLLWSRDDEPSGKTH